MSAPRDSRPPCHPPELAPLLMPQERFISPVGWAILTASVVLHVIFMLVLPTPHRHPLDQQRDILLSLKDPPPPPEREPEPEPELPKPAQPEPEPLTPPPPDTPAPEPADPGPVIGVPGGGPGAVHSGTELPSTKEEPAPPPALEPEPEPAPPPAPEPEPEPEVDVKALLVQYAAGVKASILAKKYYPPTAERLGHSGSVKLSFTLDADGSLAGVSVKSSSGFDELDSAAQDAVRRAAPFPGIPTETGRNEISLSITLTYTLN